MRLFVAIELPAAARKSLATFQNRLRRSCVGVRWVQPELLHVTVKFLGEVANDRVVSVSEAVGSAVSECEPFDLSVGVCGCFPSRGAVRVVWAGVEEPTGALRRCVDKVETAMECEGFSREPRAYSPHLTLGRVREDRSAGAVRSAIEQAELPAIEQPVDSIVVMSSVLSPQGPAYTVVSRAKLAGGE